MTVAPVRLNMSGSSAFAQNAVMVGGHVQDANGTTMRHQVLILRVLIVASTVTLYWVLRVPHLPIMQWVGGCINLALLVALWDRHGKYDVDKKTLKRMAKAMFEHENGITPWEKKRPERTRPLVVLCASSQ